jgi:predicted nucleotidyltransferase
MQALSWYNPDTHSKIERALNALQDESLGFNATPYFSQRGLFARFVWPDWPEHLQKDLAERIDNFHRSHHELLPIAPGTPEWQAVYRDWRSDPESVSVIAEAFSKNFPERVRWVESERDSRGRIGGHCYVADAGEITLHLSWRDSTSVPLGSLSEADLAAFRVSIQEVFSWAASRIRPILDALHDKLQALYGERFRGLYVFGSYARPDAGIKLSEDSDLDIALILSDFDSIYDERKRFGDITYDLSLEHGLVISVVPIREADFREGRTNFTRGISQYAVPVPVK